MIDFLQFISTDYNTRSFIEKLKPTEYANTCTGEIKHPIIYSDGPIDLLICKNERTGKEYFKLTGSVHKWFNWYNSNENHNYNDFHVSKIKEAIHRLCYLYDIDSTLIEYKTLEFGLNIITSFEPSKIIDTNIIHSKGRTHSKRNTYRNTGMFKEFDFSDYWIKIYDKGKHYKQDKNILRVEIKIKRQRAINKFGINTLFDLFDINVLNGLFEYLYHKVQELTIIDKIEPPSQLTGSEQAIYELFANTNRYNEFKTKNSRETRRNYTNRFKTIVRGHNLSKYKNEILRKLKSKFSELVQVDNLPIPELSLISTHYLTVSTHIIRGNRQPSKLIELHPDNTKKYKKRLPEEVPLSDEYEIKKHRNNKSNPRNNLKKKIEKSIRFIQGSLFPENKVIYLTRYEIEILEQWKGSRFDVLGKLVDRGYKIELKVKSI